MSVVGLAERIRDALRSAWAERAPRERLALGIAAALCLALPVLAHAYDLRHARTDAERRIDAKRLLLQRLQGVDPMSLRGGHASARIDAALRAAGLDGAVTVGTAADNQLTLSLRAAGFDAVIGALASAAPGVLVGADLRAVGDGKVEGSLTFRLAP